MVTTSSMVQLEILLPEAVKEVAVVRIDSLHTQPFYASDFYTRVVFTLATLQQQLAHETWQGVDCGHAASDSASCKVHQSKNLIVLPSYRIFTEKTPSMQCYLIYADLLIAKNLRCEKAGYEVTESRGT